MRKYIATAFLASEEKNVSFFFFGNKLDSKPLTVNISTYKYISLCYSYLAICCPLKPILKKCLRAYQPEVKLVNF